MLITRGRTATLKDMEGKDIGKGERDLMQLLMLTTHTRLKTFIYIIMSCYVRIVSLVALFNVAYQKRKACQTKKWIAKFILKVIIISRNCDQMLLKKKAI